MCAVLTPPLWRYQSSLQTLHHTAGEMWAFLLRLWSENSSWMTCSSLMRKEVENISAWHFKGSLRNRPTSLRGKFQCHFLPYDTCTRAHVVWFFLRRKVNLDSEMHVGWYDVLFTTGFLMKPIILLLMWLLSQDSWDRRRAASIMATHCDLFFSFQMFSSYFSLYTRGYTMTSSTWLSRA